jgi:hypothetical protein
LPKEPGPQDPPPLRHQVAELPELAAEITEYQAHARTCPACGKVTRALIPEAIRAHSVTTCRLKSEIFAQRTVQEMHATTVTGPLHHGVPSKTQKN